MINKDNVRITITIPKTTAKVIELLKPLHPKLTKSQIIDIAIVTYGDAVSAYYSMQTKEKGEIKNEKH